MDQISRCGALLIPETVAAKASRTSIKFVDPPQMEMHSAGDVGDHKMARRADDDFGTYERAFRTLVPSYKGNLRSKMRRFGFKIFPTSNSNVMEVSRDPTVRCLECGWKYSIQSSDECPICRSDRTRILENEDPYSNPVSIILYPLLGFLFWSVILFSVRVK